MLITAKTKLLTVIGDPVEHSLSPRIMNHFIQCSGVDYVYMAFNVKRGGISDFLRAAQLLQIKGCNITMPLKEEAASFVPRLDAASRNYGNINTLVWQQTDFVGYNTDASGFLSALCVKGRTHPGRALIIGAGGVSKTIATALIRQGTSVCICARQLNQAAALAAGLSASACDFSQLAEQCTHTDILINATPLGMEGMPNDFEDLSFVNELPSHALVFDLIYAPRKTQLLSYASERGLDIQNGLDHLIAQAAISFELFTGVKPDAAMISSLDLA